MGIHLITGGSGQGKTEYLIRQVIQESEKHKDRFYCIMVPEQFSLEMQRKVIASHPGHGYSNIDVLSFHRLAYRIFEESGRRPPDILEDLGASMVIRKILSEKEKELLYFKKSARKPGFADEVRSALMEFINFGIGWQDLRDAGSRIEGRESLVRKCEELSRLYQYFEEEIEGRYMVSEQILTAAGEMISDSSLVKNAAFYFDGFTGFTPNQYDFLRLLTPLSQGITVTVTTPLERPSDEDTLFKLSSRTVRSFMEISRETGVELKEVIRLDQAVPPRFSKAPEIALLESRLYRLPSEKKAVNRKGKDPKEGDYKDLNRTNVNISRQDERGCIHMTACRNPDGEAEFVMHKIEELVRKEGYRYRDCAVLTGDVSEYAHAFSRQARLLDIPLFEDVKKRMSYHSGIEGIRALFHLARSDYSYESVFRYLKSGISNLSDKEADFLENYILYSGIRGYRAWKEPFSHRISRYREEEIDLLRDLQARFTDETEEFCRAVIRRDLTVKEKITLLYRTLLRLSLPPRLDAMAAQKEEEGEIRRAGEYKKLFGLLLELMRKIITIFGKECMSADELSDITDAGLESLGLGIPPLSMDQVVLGDLKRTRLPQVRALFIVGLNDGIIPPVPEDRGIFNDEDKNVLAGLGLEMSANRYEQELEDEFYTYLAFTRPTDSLWFSLSDSGGDGEALRPSPLVSTLTDMFPNLKIKTYPGEEKRLYFNANDSREFLMNHLRRLKEDPDSVSDNRPFRALAAYTALQDEKGLRDCLKKAVSPRTQRMISPSYLVDLYGKELKGSVTRLEDYASCPFRFFVIYGLGLKEREEFELKAKDLGSLFHGALENYSLRVRTEGLRWKNVSEDQRDLFIEQALADALDDNLDDYFKRSSRNIYRYERVKRILTRTVDVITGQLSCSDFEPDRFEMYFGKKDMPACALIPLGEDRVMNLSGIIDRVDVCEEEDRTLIRIIDYKSGENKIELDDIYYGLKLQLALYMSAACQIYEKDGRQAAEPAGMFYYHMKDPLLKSRDMNEREYRKEFKMNGYANSDPDIIRKLDHTPDGSVTMNVRLTKKGLPYKDSPVLSSDDFKDLTEYVKEKIGDLGNQIYSGDVSQSPYNKGKRSACDYCPAYEICNPDPRGDTLYTRFMRPLKADEVMDSIRERLDLHDEENCEAGREEEV